MVFGHSAASLKWKLDEMQFLKLVLRLHILRPEVTVWLKVEEFFFLLSENCCCIFLQTAVSSKTVKNVEGRRGQRTFINPLGLTQKTCTDGKCRARELHR